MPREFRYTGRFREEPYSGPFVERPRDPFVRFGVRRPIPPEKRLSLDEATRLAVQESKAKP